MCDNNWVFVAANLQFAQFYNTTPENLVGKSVFEFYPDFESSVFYEASQSTIASGEPCTRLGYSNNLNTWIVVRTFKFNDNYNVLYTHKLQIGADKHCYVGNYDNLTSLYNRFTFEEHLEQAYIKEKSFGLVIFNINKFKQINESFGFAMGDMCLMEIAARLKQILNKYLLYRIGADQFAIIMEDTKDCCIEKINQALTLFQKPFNFDQEEFVLAGSAGFTYTDIFNKNVTDCISNAEFALDKAKKFSNTYIEYSDLNNRNTQKIRLVRDLKQALSNNQLEPYYQPQIDTITGKVCGAEALIRWRHPTRGLVPPMDFLTIAEEYDLLEDIDRLVLSKAISDISVFCEKELPLSISVNFSSKTICSPRTIPYILELLEVTSINPKLLTIEITETSLMEDIEKSKNIIHQLSQMGIQIAIDDFGTGYSSMGYLMRYPTNYLKIDKDFITNIEKNPALQILTRNMINLGHGLSMTVVAEGVETLQELNFLKKMGCDIIQGYYYSKPLPYTQFLSFVEQTGFSSLKSKFI
jgi:diguanylate cyclase (GGDEF)-like protein